MWALLIIKLNELFYFSFCLFNITKIYLPVIGKFFFNCFMYSFCHSVFQRITGLCHTDLYLVVFARVLHMHDSNIVRLCRCDVLSYWFYFSVSDGLF